MRIIPADGAGQARMEEGEEGKGGCRIQRKGRWRKDADRLGWGGEEGDGAGRVGLGEGGVKKGM